MLATILFRVFCLPISSLKNLKFKIHKTIIFLVFLWVSNLVSHTNRSHKVRMSESSVLRRIFGPKRDGVAGGWERLHNEELH